MVSRKELTKGRILTVDKIEHKQNLLFPGEFNAPSSFAKRQNLPISHFGMALAVTEITIELFGDNGHTLKAFAKPVVFFANLRRQPIAEFL